MRDRVERFFNNNKRSRRVTPTTTSQHPALLAYCIPKSPLPGQVCIRDEKLFYSIFSNSATAFTVGTTSIKIDEFNTTAP